MREHVDGFPGGCGKHCREDRDGVEFRGRLEVFSWMEHIKFQSPELTPASTHEVEALIN